MKINHEVILCSFLLRLFVTRLHMAGSASFTIVGYAASIAISRPLTSSLGFAVQAWNLIKAHFIAKFWVTHSSTRNHRIGDEMPSKSSFGTISFLARKAGQGTPTWTVSPKAFNQQLRELSDMQKMTGPVFRRTSLGTLSITEALFQHRYASMKLRREVFMWT